MTPTQPLAEPSADERPSEASWREEMAVATAMLVGLAWAAAYFSARPEPTTLDQ